jgi:hypothetical protein
MNLILFLLTVATAANGLLAGQSAGHGAREAPCASAYWCRRLATFARGNDLGNGLVVYPLLGVGAALLTVLVTVLAFVERSQMEAVVLLSLASVLSLLYFVPKMVGAVRGRHRPVGEHSWHHTQKEQL